MRVLVKDAEGNFSFVEVGEQMLDRDSVYGLADFAEGEDGGKKKKRKKKVYQTKKRVPHTRKKVPMKMLKLFDVSKDGEVVAKRQECTDCPGSFMAKHKDGRLYCGRCHKTIKE